MKKLSFFLMALSLILITAIPVSWFAGAHFSKIWPRNWMTPPANIEWLMCLPNSVIESGYWYDCINLASNNGFIDSLVLASATFKAALLSLVAAFTLLFTLASQSKVITRGRRLYMGSVAAKVLNKRFRNVGDTSFLTLPGGIQVPKKIVFRHWLMLGSVGSGKTVFIRNFINANRKVRNLILDVKGDFIADQYWVAKDGRKMKPGVLNPFDARSLEWWLGLDITDIAIAVEFAKKFVSDDEKNKFWTKATVNILVTVIASLQCEKGTEWSWADLAERIRAPNTDLKIWSEKYYPDAYKIFECAGSETADNVLLSFATECSAISEIARYWHKENGANRISFRQWLDGENNLKMLIFGWDASRSTVCESWCGAFIDLAGMYISSLRFQGGNPIHFILDEFAQLPKMKGIVKALDVGRSKQICIFIGTQSYSQIEDVYGNRAKSFRTLIGNHLYAQMSSGDDSEKGSRIVGDQHIREKEESFSEGPNSKSVSTRWVKDKYPILTQDEFHSLLGPNEHGVRVLYLPPIPDVYILDIPYLETKPLRKAFVPKAPKELHEVRPVHMAGEPKQALKVQANSFSKLLRK